MDSLIRATLIGLASCSLALLWRKGSLFAEKRAALEAKGGWLAELSHCPLCLSFNLAFLWVGLGVAVGLNCLWPELADRVLMLLASPSIAFGILQHIEGRMNVD